MGQRHRSRRADFGLRLAGAMLCVVACGAFARLVALQPPRPDEAVHLVVLCLAAVGFVAASAGSALLVLGHHLFDAIEVSPRWQPASRRHDGSGKG